MNYIIKKEQKFYLRIWSYNYWYIFLCHYPIRVTLMKYLKYDSIQLHMCSVFIILSKYFLR